MTKTRKKLIEVALPLEAINIASAREKSIRHGHPSSLHLWWARRPLAAARAVIFAQMVDDPSAWPDLFPTEKKQERERQRLFKIIEELVQWENTTNEQVLNAARNEIWTSWRRTCAENIDHPDAKTLFDRVVLPAFHDPFAGGGALPLEAQRLGLDSYASDLNPVPVLVNKSMIEIPPRFAGCQPVNSEWQKSGAEERVFTNWTGARGLANDVSYYGKWIRNEAEKRIGDLYPTIEITKEMASDRPDLKSYVGQRLKVISWIWARTVKSPNPAFNKVAVPLASTFMLSTKSGKEAYIEPLVEGQTYRFVVKIGKPKDLERAKAGTSAGKRAGFLCVMTGTPLSYNYIREEGAAGRMGVRLMAIVAEGDRGRLYLSPTSEHEDASNRAHPEWQPDTPLHGKSRVNVSNYGLNTYGDLFTPRQLLALTTFSELIGEARSKIINDAIKAGLPSASSPIDRAINHSTPGATEYADAVAIYLSFALSKQADLANSLCRWEPIAQCPRNLFGRQAIPMIWDFAEGNTLGDSSGAWTVCVEGIAKAFAKSFEFVPPTAKGFVQQADAARQEISKFKVISCDPPYYDNIAYADLSDFFYVWLRRTLRPIYPELFSTMAVPKEEELVATPYRHGDKEKAEAFFLDGMTQAMQRLAEQAHPTYPITIYYAFKQSESDSGEGTTNTGWDTFLAAVIKAGFAISGTWPIRTENDSRMIGQGANALASSIVLVCRPRASNAPTASRRDFLNSLKTELPAALAHLQAGNIAPVDLAQASIGPGMAVFSRYSKVIDADGNTLSVRSALALINQTLDEALAKKEGDFDAETRWALAWFEQMGFEEGDFGIAEQLSKAKNTAVAGLVDAGIVRSGRGKVQLLKPQELTNSWDPGTDQRLTTWESVHRLIQAQVLTGEAGAAAIVAKLASKAETARELCYRLYSICERKKRANDAMAYNALVQSWPEIVRLAQQSAQVVSNADDLFGQE